MNIFKRSLDLIMLVVILFLMAFQVTDEMPHEWLGMVLVFLVIVHQFLNRKWYRAVGKGRYRAYRLLSTLITFFLLLSFILTAVSGMVMSVYAVPFLYGLGQLNDPQTLHLAMSHWTFILAGLHLGLHLPFLFGQVRLAPLGKKILALGSAVITLYGLYLFFIQHHCLDYLLFEMHFIEFAAQTAAPLVILENLLMLLAWTGIGTGAALLLRK